MLQSSVRHVDPGQRRLDSGGVDEGDHQVVVVAHVEHERSLRGARILCGELALPVRFADELLLCFLLVRFCRPRGDGEGDFPIRIIFRPWKQTAAAGLGEALQ